MTKEQFIDRVIEVVKGRFPLVKIARAEQSFSLKINGHVAPMENLYRICELQPEGLQHHIERWTVELIRAGEGTPDQDAKFSEIKERILPIVVAENGSEASESKMVTQPLVPGLQVAYAVDNDRTVTYIPPAYLKRWKVNVDNLHETAIHNLVAKSETINAHAAADDDGKINLILFQTMDGFDASRILLPTLHDRLREHLGNQFAAAIPNRDILLCFRDDEETVDRLRDQIANDYRQMPHQITDKILLITPDGIAPHD
ncbi:MAG TPA: DUF1444 family protein [Tepidisphaeraceae bacterium]|jgi:hypothetical protein|nr:DUF1444 family protein [Tepidisphaeraceae bacterium]